MCSYTRESIIDPIQNCTIFYSFIQYLFFILERTVRNYFLPIFVCIYDFNFLQKNLKF
ncbi:unnamed protein product [Schistosoma mattheei]|uniref:Uncharacterized protein n=1 Tax=Schistosoma mattheei TaxID=31246 RepID=A0A183NHI0_9TREM|nr:unnamed protein product [Schistosoma mattheei]